MAERVKLEGDKRIIRNNKSYYVFVCEQCSGAAFSYEQGYKEVCYLCHGVSTIIRRPTPTGVSFISVNNQLITTRLAGIAK